MVLLSWLAGGVPTLCKFGTTPEAGRDHVHRLLDPFSRGGRCRPEGSDQDGSQLDGGVMAPKAGEDVLSIPRAIARPSDSRRSCMPASTSCSCLAVESSSWSAAPSGEGASGT
jgi:hypothetical protein